MNNGPAPDRACFTSTFTCSADAKWHGLRASPQQAGPSPRFFSGGSAPATGASPELGPTPADPPGPTEMEGASNVGRLQRG